MREVVGQVLHVFQVFIVFLQRVLHTQFLVRLCVPRTCSRNLAAQPSRAVRYTHTI